jgi:hypothetical protein
MGGLRLKKKVEFANGGLGVYKRGAWSVQTGGLTRVIFFLSACLAWIHDTLHITPVSMQTKQVNMFGKVSENEFANGGLTVRNEFANGGLTVCT